MRVGLLLVFLLAQDPDPLPALLARLADENLAVRDDAAQALVRLGEPALERLRASSTDDADLKLRLADIVARIEAALRRRDFKGGEEVDGLKARLTAEALTVKPGEPLKLTLEIMNVGPTAREFLVPLGVSRSGPGLISSRFQWSALLAVAQKSGEAPKRLATLRACGGRMMTPRTLTLAPGETWKQAITIPTCPTSPAGEQAPFVEGLPAGEFEARATYPMTLGISADLASDTLKLKVAE